MNIIIDDRESAVIPFLKKQESKNEGITCLVKRINIGDYALCYNNNIKVIIERKTWKDLSASIRDGRKANVNKLLKLRKEIGCKIIYLIEGNAYPNPDQYFARIQYKNLISHLNHLMFRDDIHMVYSKDQEYTAYKLFELCKNYMTLDETNNEINECNEIEMNNEICDEIEICDEMNNGMNNEMNNGMNNKNKICNEINEINECNEINQIETIENMYDMMQNIIQPTEPILDHPTIEDNNNHNISKLNEKQTSETNTHKLILKCIPKIGYITVDKLYDNNITLYSIYTKELDFRKMNIDSNKEKYLKKVKSLINDDDNKEFHIKILSSIPLVSKKTAEIILKKVSLKSIMIFKNHKFISDIKKTATRRVGKKAATNIITYLTS